MDGSEGTTTGRRTFDPLLLERVEAVLATADPPGDRMDAVVRILGEELRATRVVLYGESSGGDRAVRVRSAWSADGHAKLPEFASELPLLTWRPSLVPIVTDAPRGRHCPADCVETEPGCVLRGFCSSIVLPLQVGERRLGRIGVHARTGRRWSDEEQLAVRVVATRLAVFIAERRIARVQGDVDAMRAGISMTVLHQLATPITVIQGTLEHVRQHGVDASRPLLAAADEAVARLRRLSEDLVALTSGEAVQVEARDIRPEVRLAIARARSRHPEAHIDLEMGASIPDVRAEPDSVRRTLAALLDNAIRYAQGPVACHVQVTFDGSVVTVRVRDDGPGVPADALEVLGGTFDRSDPGMRMQRGGTGLGLAIAARVAQRAGGSFHVEPRGDARGTQATLCLPAAVEGHALER